MYFLGFEQARYIFRMLYYFPCCLSITGDVINIKRVNKVRYVLANELRNLFSRNLSQNSECKSSHSSRTTSVSLLLS